MARTSHLFSLEEQLAESASFAILIFYTIWNSKTEIIYTISSTIMSHGI